MHDLTTTEGTMAYLQGTHFVATGVQPLSGGHSAFTYRATLKSPLPTGEATIILKHFEAYEASFNTKKAPIERGSFEYKALIALGGSGLFHSNSIVQVPSPIHYDPETRTIFMADLGCLTPIWGMLARSAEKARAESSDPQMATKEAMKLASRVGSAIGDFLGRFHNWAASPERVELLADLSRNVAARACLSSYRRCMIQALDLLGHEASDARTNDVLAMVRVDDFMQGNVLAMGDCTLNNVMVPSAFDPNCLRIYILDWEMTRPAPPELDIGELTGTTVSFAHRYNSHEIHPFLPALHRAYGRHYSLSPIKTATLTGVYAMGLATMKSRSKNPGEEYLRGAATGFELLKLAYNADEKGIREHEIMKYLFL